MSKIFLYVAAFSCLGLLGWNIFLIEKIEGERENLKELQYKLEMCQGDVEVLRYDLITSRDSVRILNEFPERRGN